MSDEGFPHMPKFDSIESQTYDASCHCGTVQFTVTLAPPLAKQKPVSCNCSICSRNGYLLVYPLREQLNVMSGEGALRDYAFGRKRNRHKFCSKCGSSVFFDPRMAEYGEEPDLLGVNVRMFKNVSLKELEIMHFDGWNQWPFIDSSHLK